MKKVLLTLSLAVAALTKVTAQEADLQAFVVFDTLDMVNGYWLSDTLDRANDRNINLYLHQNPSLTYANINHTADSFFLLMGSINNGPDPIDAGSTYYFQHSYGRYLTEAECAANNVPFDPDARYWWTWSAGPISQPTDVDDYATIVAPGTTNPLRFSTDSIGLLLDWDLWVDSGIFDPVGPPFESFVPGKAYGMFYNIRGTGNYSTPTNIDDFRRNNVYAHKIVWKGHGMSLKDVLVKRNTEVLNVFPNPASTEIKFDYNFTKNTIVSLVIKDMTGKAVKVQNYGRKTVGKETFNVNISNLANGNYIVELQTGESVAVSKLVVNK